MDAQVENMDVLDDYWGEVIELDFLISFFAFWLL